MRRPNLHLQVAAIPSPGRPSDCFPAPLFARTLTRGGEKRSFTDFHDDRDADWVRGQDFLSQTLRAESPPPPDRPPVLSLENLPSLQFSGTSCRLKLFHHPDLLPQSGRSA